jgi:rod shape-determining protein MreD
MSRRKQHSGLILGSFVLALLLTIVPLPDSMLWFRPYWAALTTGSLMGQHALSLVIVAYITGRFRLRMRFFPLWQQALMVLALLLNDRIIYSWIHSVSGRGWPDWELLWAPLVATLLWPWVFLALDRARQRLRAR